MWNYSLIRLGQNLVWTEYGLHIFHPHCVAMAFSVPLFAILHGCSEEKRHWSWGIDSWLCSNCAKAWQWPTEISDMSEFHKLMRLKIRSETRSNEKTTNQKTKKPSVFPALPMWGQQLFVRFYREQKIYACKYENTCRFILSMWIKMDRLLLRWYYHGRNVSVTALMVIPVMCKHLVIHFTSLSMPLSHTASLLCFLLLSGSGSEELGSETKMLFKRQ